MAKIQVRLVTEDGVSRIRSYSTFEGDTSDMHIEIDCRFATVALVAPVRLDATKQNLLRVQGHTPSDYYARFDQYPEYDGSGWVRNKHLIPKAEFGPACANEFGFTKALAACNEISIKTGCLEHYYFAQQTYYLLMRPPGGFDCINNSKVRQSNDMRGRRRIGVGDTLISYGPTERMTCYGFEGYNFRQFDWPNGTVKGRGSLELMPVVRYTLRRPELHRSPKISISGKLKGALQHAIHLHNAGEELLLERPAPFGEYNAIGTGANYLKVEQVVQ